MQVDERMGVSVNGDPPLTHLFGPSGNVKILSALLQARHKELTISEIHRISGVARNTVYLNIDDLVELGIVRQSGQRGDSRLFQINKENAIFPYLQVIQELIIEDHLRPKED